MAAQFELGETSYKRYMLLYYLSEPFPFKGWSDSIFWILNGILPKENQERMDYVMSCSL
jgi:hypothetical protein